jgi:hypothetical protein
MNYEMAMDHEQVHGSDFRGMVAQKGAPSLTGRSPSLARVFGNCRLGDVIAELKHLPMDARGSQEWILDAHSADQSAQFRIDPWPPSPRA